MTKRFYPLLILNHDSDLNDAITHCKNTLVKKQFGIDITSNIEEVFLTKEDTNSKALQELTTKTNMSINPDTIRTIYIHWTETLFKTGNFNKILKLLEEPPINTIIFILHNKEILPKTITSRGIQIELEKQQNNLTQSDDAAGQYTILKNTFIDFINKKETLSETVIKMKKNSNLSKEMLENLLELLLNQDLNFKQYNAIGRVINKYNQNQKLNLSPFENLLLPIRMLVKKSDLKDLEIYEKI